MGFKLVWLRWLLILPFIAGPLGVITPVDQGNDTLLILDLVSALGCALLLTSLNQPFKNTLWAWVILFIFLVGYYLKTYLIAWNLNSPEVIEKRFTPEWLWLSPSNLTCAYSWFSLAFVAFCGTAWLLLFVRRRGERRANVQTEIPDSIPTGRAVTFLVILGALSFLLFILRASFGIGIMGVVNQRLPLGLDTLLFRFQSDIIPALLLLCVWVLDKRGSRAGLLLALALLLLHFVSVSVITGSRAGLIRFALLVLFLWLVDARMTRARTFLVASMVLGTLVFFPFVSWIRLARMQAAEDASGAVRSAVENFSMSDWTEMVELAANQMVIRITGAEGIWFVQGRWDCGLSAEWGSTFSFQERLVEYYTRDVVGVKDAADFRAPGIIGALMLVGGLPGVVFLWPLCVLLIHFTWICLLRARTASVVIALFAFFVFLFGEGTLLIQDFIAFVLAASACELSYRAWLI